MGISVVCGNCQVAIQAKPELAGKRVRCPRCQHVLQVPASEVTAPGAPAPEPVAKRAAGQRVEPGQPPAHTAGPNVPVRRQAASSTARPSSPPAAGPSRLASTANQSPNVARQPATPQAAVGDRGQDAQKILGAFQGNIARVRVPMTYRLGIVLVAGVMIVLPLVYLALIVLAGYSMYWHAISNTWLFEIRGGGRARGMAALVYLAPLFAGGVLILFMIKPLFARPERQEKRRSLSRSGEPLLFAFVDRLCVAVGSPQPKRIDVNCEVNASASFRRGLLSFLGNDLVLTIGLPLAAGLSLTQFAGVLAHEFGHFTQGFGMRLTYIVRTINWWFTRVVYERDEWDARLVEWSEDVDGRIAIFLYLARGCVWLTRRILWCLMMVGHAVSGFMMRQMEFDADRHEARLAGSQAVESTMRQLSVLGLATNGAYADLNTFYREGRLGDNLPKLIQANVRQIPAELHLRIDQRIAESKTGWFDTHPADQDRIASARRENAAGIFHVDQPTSALFSDFDALSRNVTWDLYRDLFGGSFKPTDMHPVEDLLAGQEKQQVANEALTRYFQGQFSLDRPLVLPASPPGRPADARQSLACVKRARQQLVEQASAGVDRPIALDAVKFEQMAGNRLVAALELLHVPQVMARIDGAAALQEETAGLYVAFEAVNRQAGWLTQLQAGQRELNSLIERMQQRNSPSLIGPIQGCMGQINTQLQELRGRLSDVTYPFDHARGEISIGQYLLEELPDPRDLGQVYSAGGAVLDNGGSLYFRLAGRLVEIAEQVESAVGLPPLEAPASEEHVA